LKRITKKRKIVQALVSKGKGHIYGAEDLTEAKLDQQITVLCEKKEVEDRAV